MSSEFERKTSSASPLLPSCVAPGKFFLPAFNVTATVPHQEAACALEQGMMELLQYTGNCLRLFNIAMNRDGADETDPLAADGASEIPCVVAAATRTQVFASVMVGNGASDATRLANLAANSSPSLEPWERAYVEAVCAFVTFDYDRCIELCLRNIETFPFDPFTARLLVIATYLGSDQAALCEGFSAIVACTEEAIASQQASNDRHRGPRHALHLVLPIWLGFAAFGFEESRRDVALAERLARRAIRLVEENNARYFPNNNPAADQPDAKGALAAASPSFGFLCVFGVHVILHCFEARGDPRGALEAVSALDPRLWKLSVHLAGHLHWHLALCHLECGATEEALNIFRAVLANPSPGDPYELADTGSFAWRLWITMSFFNSVDVESPRRQRWVHHQQPLAATAASVIKATAHHWRAWEPSRTRQVPFFHVHSVFAQALASWCGAPTEGFFLLPAPATSPLGISSAPQPASTPMERRALLCRMADTAASALQDDSVSREEKATKFWIALSSFAEPRSVALWDSSIRAAHPMGGSVAQMRLLSLPVLVAFCMTRRPGARVAWRSVGVHFQSSPLYADAAAEALSRL